MNQKGQVVLILILVMTVALAIGVSVIQRSLSDVSTSSKVEQSSRAFAAAEAGIEKAIQTGTSLGSLDLGNNSEISGVQTDNVPAANQALEYPPMSKEEIANVWLADPTSSIFPSCDVGKICYSAGTLGIYWGTNGNTDHPAIEVTVIYDASGVYKSKKYYLDRYPNDPGRNNDFDPTNVTCPAIPAISTSLSPTPKTFYCMKNIPVDAANLPGLSRLIMVRARLLYASASHSFAVKPTSGSLPIQARLFTSTGRSGNTQRTVQVLRLDRVVPFYFDYAIFSVGDITK